MRKILILIGVFCLGLIISGCTTKTSKYIPKDGVLTRDEVIFPDVKRAWISSSFPDKADLAKLELGLEKDEVRTLIGSPHFQEGYAYVYEWDYIFNLKEKGGDPDKICQFKIVFDENKTVGSMHWLPENCLSRSSEKIETFELESDFLFDFSSSKLKPAGAGKVSQIISKLNRENLKSIEILGYTDPIGSNLDNLALSQRRANSVKDEFVRQGIDSRKITTRGLGKSEQVKICDASVPKNEYIECLAPNRRVVITAQSVGN